MLKIFKDCGAFKFGCALQRDIIMRLESSKVSGLTVIYLYVMLSRGDLMMVNDGHQLNKLREREYQFKNFLHPMGLWV